MSNGVILYLVEGKKERSVTSQIRSLNEFCGFDILPSGNSIVYGTTIYGLFKEVKKYLQEGIEFDLFPILKKLANRPENEEIDILSKHDISEIYLIFDYDPHATNFSQDKIKAMCEVFNDEQTIGKLFINYPMVEVFRHCYKLIKAEELFFEKTCPLPINQLSNYKNYVSSIHIDITNMDCPHTLKKVISDTIIKTNFLVNNILEYPINKSSIQQELILEKQLSYSDDFHLLSGIPLLIHYYHRHEILFNALKTNTQ
ncbi:hypothetical protein MWMV17_MWMV17_03207 [Acinetobacter calcoaceticus]|uniref:DUF4435 domain-containing protein n=1 Tax=Acinetobacter calcoaceticus DSM 30006 = CIP 81.8 TaxID=981331 RepID=A0ABP2UCJ1_ACICA|nr:hypothetical protein [Acinetobacter calcoaceticus]ENV97765.1 hypothetical protein F936_03417 [Acinetobacter calcoaceticus DSM 30006 = CIP 81.8]CAI3159407.1 hypothetical protein MWMV17_MWMV17_03207 [Acinetobacter calcoaceticus]SUU51709.1 Uncharacterised protein [Acinetobacter calcoaceticus]